jgi:hypothetical protein
MPCLGPLRWGITSTARAGDARTGDIEADLGASGNLPTYLATVSNALTTCLLALA